MAQHRDMVLEADSVRVVFRWVEDRYKHEVVIPHHGAALVEAPADGAGDPSGLETPVFTEAQPQGGVLFLSGQSGDRVWSMSIEQAADGGLAFDVACRAGTPLPRPGSRYELHNDRLVVTPEPAGKRPAPAMERDGGPAAGGLPRVVLLGPPLAEGPATSRWRFRLSKK